MVSGPSAHYGHAMAYDASRGVTVLFGGYTGFSNGETWEWNGTTWTQRMVSGPSPRYSHAMAYDASRGVTVLFGGYYGGFAIGETLELGVACIASPSITTHPVASTACPTGSAGFMTTAAGTGPFTYQWQLQTAPNTWQSLANDPAPLPCGGGAFAYATPLNSPSVTIGIRPCPGNPTAPQHFQVRCIVTNACGSVTSNEATYAICPADFDCFGSLTITDIFDFLAAWFAGCAG